MKTPEHPEDLKLVGHRFEWTRIQLNLRVVEVVREAGYENINKGCRRLRAIEDADPQPEPVYERFAYVLDIDLEGLVEELEEERQQRLEKLRQDIPPRWLGSLLESALEREEMTVEEVASSTQGTISSGRLHRLKLGRHRLPSDEEIEALGEALDIDPQALRNARIKERNVYDQRGEAPKIIVRAIPGFYYAQPIFGPGSTKEYLDYAARYAREQGLKICLVFGDGRSVYFEPDGSRFESFDPPVMEIG